MEIALVGLVFLLTSIPFIAIAMRAFARDRVIKKWPRAPGVVTSTSLEESTHRVTDKNTGLYSYSTYYTPKIRYTYTVGGESLEGKNIALAVDGTATSHDSATRIIDKYPPDSRIDVLYDPADPKTAYLEVRRSIGGFILLAFGLLWLALGTMMMTIAVVT